MKLWSAFQRVICGILGHSYVLNRCLYCEQHRKERRDWQ